MYHSVNYTDCNPQACPIATCPPQKKCILFRAHADNHWAETHWRHASVASTKKYVKQIRKAPPKKIKNNIMMKRSIQDNKPIARSQISNSNIPNLVTPNIKTSQTTYLETCPLHTEKIMSTHVTLPVYNSESVVTKLTTKNDKPVVLKNETVIRNGRKMLRLVLQYTKYKKMTLGTTYPSNKIT